MSSDNGLLRKTYGGECVYFERSTCLAAPATYCNITIVLNVNIQKLTILERQRERISVLLLLLLVVVV